MITNYRSVMNETDFNILDLLEWWTHSWPYVEAGKTNKLIVKPLTIGIYVFLSFIRYNLYIILEKWNRFVWHESINEDCTWGLCVKVLISRGIQVAQNCWAILATCCSMLSHNKKYSPFCSIGKRTICQQRLDCGPTVSCSESCSYTLQNRELLFIYYWHIHLTTS